MMIDTHTHLYDDDTIAAQDAHIQRAIDAGVSRMYMPNCDSGTINSMLQIASRFPDHCFPMIGLHPCYAKENVAAELDIMEAYLKKQAFAAIGEIGLDYYWDRNYDAQQQLAFERQINWAMAYELPIVIHSRQSTRECIDTVKRLHNGRLKGIFHCFSGTLEQAKEIADMGMYIGIGGVVTYKKSQLPELLRASGLEHVVLETDAPYLAPVPYRGKKNESTYITVIAAKVAEIMEISPEEVAVITTENARKIFG